MIYRIEVSPRAREWDARGLALQKDVEIAGFSGISGVEVHDIYFLSGGELDAATVDRACEALLVDPVIETFRVGDVQAGKAATEDGTRVVEVTPKPGVTDTAAESLIRTARAIGIDTIERAATGKRYVLAGTPGDDDVRAIAGSLLANEVVQAWAMSERLPPPFVAEAGTPLPPEIVPVRAADDDSLLAISKERRLALDLKEMRAVKAHFVAEGRDATDLELETLAQTWSEHCVHKTFKALIHHSEPGREEVVDSIFDQYIKAATRATDSPWLKSVFVDNAGIVGFDDKYDIAFKVETHNHPSALEPFGGANTGVGGVVRDIIGVSAYPIATTDVLCFGPADLPADALPHGVLHPRRIAAGVISGVEDYGNKMGIPTVNGAILYDRGYTANPLVFCGCLGILPKGSHKTDPQIGDHIVVLGGRTGRDGLRGATFSSMEMGTETALVAGSSVQIGHPIAEKAVLEAIKIARDEGLYTAITDCGAGGLSSAVGEMGSELGAEVHLERVTLKYAGLSPWEVWLSEAQERMVMAVSEPKRARLQAICDRLDVDMYVLGTFTGDGRLRVLDRGEVVGDMPMALLHDGIPRRELTSRWDPPTAEQTAVPELGDVDIAAELLALLSEPNIRSKEDTVRTYDHEVQAGTVVKPFSGPRTDGPNDGAVLVPLDRVEGRGDEAAPMAGPGVALAVGVNPQYGKLDPYAMAWSAVDECFRNLVAVGADPDRVAILDNFCWGNPRLPDRLGALVRCSRGCYDAAVEYGAPYISGKDSLNNEYTGADGDKHAIPGTLLISGLGIVPVADMTATSALKAPKNKLYVIGETANELGGSAFWRRRGALGDGVPQPAAKPLVRLRALHKAIAQGVVAAVHDCSEGGVAVAVAEMCVGGRLGADIDLSALPVSERAGLDAHVAAFSESNGRFVVEVAPGRAAALAALLTDVAHAPIGTACEAARLRLHYGGQACGETSIDDLARAFLPAS